VVNFSPRGHIAWERTMIRRLALLLLIAAGLSPPLPVQAQINPFRGSRAVPLSGDDISALTAATYRLLGQARLVAGASEAWSSPSGASGEVTAGNAVHHKGLSCRVMNYQIRIGGSGAERARSLTWCKTKDGWKIA
jgi:surface antigen